ncbi:hypothetical protein [Caballeronia calidae]|uniref:hypothetical protein n=1 Tax=Caballeronia calidae TaxID=1777139 RepID=UPI001E31E5E0|nr:hypothetical protein [Caballeronia calidae]
MFLQLFHLRRDRGLREVKLLGGAGKTQSPGHGFEDLQLTQGGVAQHGDPSSINDS